MRILFIIHSLSSGGAERVLTVLANDINRQGHDITIAMNSTCLLYTSPSPRDRG